MYTPTMLGDYKFESKFSWLPTKIDDKLIWFKTYKVTYIWSETTYEGRDWIIQKRELINSDLQEQSFLIL